MNKENAHLYLPLVQALADGELQTRETINSHQWVDSPLANFSKGPELYRRKPNNKSPWYRVAEMKTYTALASNNTWQASEEMVENSPGFVRWLTERIEYEVTK